MSHPHPIDVLIVGAGPAGLALAADLLRRGLAVRLVDRAAAPSPLSRATSVTPRTLEVLDDLGALPDVLAAGVPITRTEARQGPRLAFRLAFPESDATRFPFLLNASQRDTERALTALVHRLGGAVERGRALVGLRQERDGAVALVDGPGGVEEVRAGWLVGADGGRSTVRRTLGVPFRGRGGAAGETIVLGDVRLDRDLAPDRLHSWFSADGALLALPFPEPGRWRLTAALSPAEEASGRFTDPSPERFAELYRRRTGDGRTALTDLQGFSVYRVNQRVVDHYRRGRVLLVGDAAHVHTPAGGLGMNTGIQDAYALGWRLAAAVRGGPDAEDAEDVVDGYERERRPVAEALLSRTDGLQRLYGLRDPRAQRVRDAALRSLLGLGPVRRAALVRAGQLDVTYRTGRRLPGRRGPAVGDRAPDGPARRPDGTPVRLHEQLRGTGPVVVLLTGSGRGEDPRPAAVARTAADRGAPVVLVARDAAAAAGHPAGRTLLDPGGELHRRYGATAPTAVVVRPDGHIARIGAPDPAAVAAALRPLLPAAGAPRTVAADAARPCSVRTAVTQRVS